MYILLDLSLFFHYRLTAVISFSSWLYLHTFPPTVNEFCNHSLLVFQSVKTWKSRLSTCTPAVSNVSTTRWSSSSPPLVSWGSPTSLCILFSGVLFLLCKTFFNSYNSSVLHSFMWFIAFFIWFRLSLISLISFFNSCSSWINSPSFVLYLFIIAINSCFFVVVKIYVCLLGW